MHGKAGLPQDVVERDTVGRLRDGVRRTEEAREGAVGRGLGDEDDLGLSPFGRADVFARRAPARGRRRGSAGSAGAGVQVRGDGRVLVSVHASAENRRVRRAAPVREHEVDGQERAARSGDVEAHVAVAGRGGAHSVERDGDLLRIQPLRVRPADPDGTAAAVLRATRARLDLGFGGARPVHPAHRPLDDVPRGALAHELEEMDLRRRAEVDDAGRRIARERAGGPAVEEQARRARGRAELHDDGKEPDDDAHGIGQNLHVAPNVADKCRRVRPRFRRFRPHRETSGPCDNRHGAC